MVKKGDTLIEVAIAVGIFSLIAISVASVISSSTSGAQLSLETTLAREEIDAQAETIRFIHNAYTTNRENKDRPLPKLWEKIVENAIDLEEVYCEGGNQKECQESILQYSPQTCAELYDEEKNPVYDKAFVINPRKINDGPAAYISLKDSDKLVKASTYPRLIFGNNNKNDDNSDLQNTHNYTDLYHAEGIYVIAVKDPNSTNIINIEDTGEEDGESAYYDFYIRTCWYGTGNEEPSTISTVIRLHDSHVTTSLGRVSVHYPNNEYNDAEGVFRYQTPVLPARNGYIFKGWCDGTVSGDVNDDGGQKCSGQTYAGGETLKNIENTDTTSYNLTQAWEHIKYRIRYVQDNIDPISDTICYPDENDHCRVNSQMVYRSGYKFGGWCTTQPVSGNCKNITIQPGENLGPGRFPELFTPGNTLKLYPIWIEHNETITVKLTWGSSPSDLDSHIYGQKSDGSYFHTYFGSKTYSEGRTIASLDRDVVSGYGPETITLNTLGGKTYYYYVYNWSGGYTISGATVEVRNLTSGERYTYYSNNAVGSGAYWNVFAYKNGRIVVRQTHSSSPQTSY